MLYNIINIITNCYVIINYLPQAGCSSLTKRQRHLPNLKCYSFVSTSPICSAWDFTKNLEEWPSQLHTYVWFIWVQILEKKRKVWDFCGWLWGSRSNVRWWYQYGRTQKKSTETNQIFFTLMKFKCQILNQQFVINCSTTNLAI